MSFKTTTEQRIDPRIFAGNDPAHTATGACAITTATPVLTPLMLDGTTGSLVARRRKRRHCGRRAGVAT